MSMSEIGELLKGGILLIQSSELPNLEKRNVIWSLENLPEKYEMDASGFARTENGDSSLYEEVNPYKLGEIIDSIASELNRTSYIYDWSAFLLNFSEEYFCENGALDSLKEGELKTLRDMYHKCSFSDYQPKHATLTLYKNGFKYFSDEQNKLIMWFLS